MQVLPYLLKKPTTGDTGAIFFPALEYDIAQLDAHTHDGITSPNVPSSSIILTSQTILAAGWIALGGGNYRQLVTMSAPMAYNTRVPTFRNTATGDLLYPTVEKASANTFWVYINDNSIGLTIIYL